jgi:hypothetical protein
MNQVASNFNKIIDKIPFLLDVLSKINSTNIKYGLYAGSHVSILTSNRIPVDVDFLVADEDMMTLKNLFPFAETKDYGDGFLLYIGRNKEIEFVSFTNINISNSHYLYRLTKLCWDNSSILNGENFEVRILNPIDTILIKAMFQRGKDQGKNDLEDIKALIEKTKQDKNYLHKRLIEVKSDERLEAVLRQFNLI